MRDIDVPPLVPETESGSLADVPHRWVSTQPGRPLFAVREGETWRDVTASEFVHEMRALAKGFVAAGIEPGDRVAILSRTRYEWTLADFALWTAAAVPVPIYETSSPAQARWILQDSGAVAAIVETDAQVAMIANLRSEIPALHDIWSIEGRGFDELVTAGSETSEEDLDKRRQDLDRSSLATLIYTSGTTGRPKGCELTHGNFLTLAENAVERLEDVIARPGAQTLIFLPLAHVFARFIQVAVVVAGARTGHCSDSTRLIDDLGTFRPTFILAVPRVFEKIYNAAEQKAESVGRGRVFRQAVATAQEWSRAQAAGGPGPLLRVKHAIFDRLVYRRLRHTMGGAVQYAISGGAALGERLGHFFRGVGVVVLEGYGLTETTAPAAVNTPEFIKIGTVGRPLPGVAIKIDDNGEILVKGSNVFRGYHGEAQEGGEEPTHAEWLKTGDLGWLDDDGFLRVTGRSKELIVTAGGKNVSPAPLEDAIRSHPIVSQCMLVGDKRAFVSALVTLDPEMLRTWAQNQGLAAMSPAEAASHAFVQEAIRQGIEETNQQVSRAESIRRFLILPNDFTEASGHLTPSSKVKRQQVTEDFATEIEELYSGGGISVDT